MIEIVVNENKWSHGLNRADWQKTKNHKMNVLKHPSGYMCCLGFACDQLGQKGIKNTPTPEDLKRPNELVKKSFLYKDDYNFQCNSGNTEEIIGVNDSSTDTLKDKKRDLKKLFKKVGLKLKFVKE